MHFNDWTLSIVFYLSHIHLANSIYTYMHTKPRAHVHTCAPISLWSPTQICIIIWEIPILSSKLFVFLMQTAGNCSLPSVVSSPLYHKHTLSLSLSHTLTSPLPILPFTHTLSLTTTTPLFLSQTHIHSLCLSLIQTPPAPLYHTHMQTHTLFFNLSLTHSLL